MEVIVTVSVSGVVTITGSRPAAPTPVSVASVGPWSLGRGNGGRIPAIRRVPRPGRRRPSAGVLGAGEDADDVPAPLDLLVQPLQPIGRPDLLPVRDGGTLGMTGSRPDAVRLIRGRAPCSPSARSARASSRPPPADGECAGRRPR